MFQGVSYCSTFVKKKKEREREIERRRDMLSHNQSAVQKVVSESV
jgi:hypothetical protein